MTATGVRMTADELLRLPRGRMRHELIDGELHEYPLAGAEHGYIVGLLAGAFGGFRYRQSPAVRGVFLIATGFWLAQAPDTVRAPDVAYVSAERLPQARVPGYPMLAPDLVVEVVSPSDTAAEIQAKIDQWLQAGARLAWVIYPATQSALVYRADGTVQLLHADDLLSGEDILPGFSYRLGNLF